MKNLLKTLLFIAIVVSNIAAIHSQNASKITVVYEMDFEMEGMDEQTKSMMENSTMEVAHSGDYTRVTNNVSMSKTIITTNDKTEESLMLIEAMGQVMAIPLDVSQLNEQNEKDDKEFEIEIMDETMKILDYVCTKVVMKSKEGKESITMYVAEDLKPAGKSFKYSHPEIKGMPLRIEASDGSSENILNAISVELSATGDFTTEVPKNAQVMEYDMYNKMQQFMKK